VLLSTHVVDDLTELCDRVLVLSRGRVISDGSPRDLVARWSSEPGVSSLEDAYLATLAADRRP
jgi:ABC-2 type transport system ATP-binding protein